MSTTSATPWQQPTPKYHITGAWYFIELMLFIDQFKYDLDATFTPAVLGQLKPEQIKHWMNKKGRELPPLLQMITPCMVVHCH